MKSLSILLISLTLFFANTTTAFPGEQRTYHHDWLVVCQERDRNGDWPGGCRASTGLRDKSLVPYGDGTYFQFTLERSEADGSLHIEFYHTLEDSYPSGLIHLQVDKHPVMSFNMRNTQCTNCVLLSESESAPLIPLLEKGRWLKISYVSSKGKPVNVTLSLRGSRLAIDEMDMFEHWSPYGVH